MNRIEEIKKIILENTHGSWTAVIKKDIELYNFFMEYTNKAVKFIDNPSMSLRKTVLMKAIKDPPKCPVCDGVIKNTIKKGSNFAAFCSGKCKNSEEGKLSILNKKKEAFLKNYGVEYAAQSEEIKNKRKNTCLKKYGVEYAAQSEEIKNKRKNTCLKKYGVEHPIQSDEIKEKMKETMIERYGVENPSQSEEIKEKKKETCLKNYGVEYALQAEEIKEKSRETCLKKYGVGCSLQSEEIKEKIKETCLKKYGVENPAHSEKIKEKIKETCLERYGVDHPLQSEEVKEKIKETCLKKYGVGCTLQSEEVKEKIKETCLKKYGVENPSQSEEIKEKRKETCLGKYGVECSLQNEEVKKRMKETCLKKYGVENPVQSEEIKEKIKETSLRRYGVGCSLKSDEVKEKIKETCLKKYGAEYYQQGPEARTLNLIKLKKHMKEKNLQPLFTDEEYIYSQIDDELKYKCLTCNNEYSVINNPSKNNGIYHYNFLCSCSKYRSKQEIELAWFLESLEIPFKNNEKLKGKDDKKLELDLYLEGYNFGIEYHGLYWHSEPTKESSYHQNKYLFFKDLNIDVLQIFENDWTNKRNIVESIIKRRLGRSENILTAEETKLKEVPYQEYLNFLEENSINPTPSIAPTQILGLYHNESLVQLLALNNSEIIAHETKVGYSVIDGLHKLLSNLKQSLTISIDLRYSTGQEFIDYGFIPINTTKPNCYYTDWKEIFLTEQPNLRKIYDCGNLLLKYIGE